MYDCPAASPASPHWMTSPAPGQPGLGDTSSVQFLPPATALAVLRRDGQPTVESHELVQGRTDHSVPAGGPAGRLGARLLGLSLRDRASASRSSCLGRWLGRRPPTVDYVPPGARRNDHLNHGLPETRPRDHHSCSATLRHCAGGCSRCPTQQGSLRAHGSSQVRTRGAGITCL